MCNCNKPTMVVIAGASGSTPVQIGEAGLTKVYYSGEEKLKLYPGCKTKAQYKFGLKRVAGWVDNRDLAELLACQEEGKAVFHAVG